MSGPLEPGDPARIGEFWLSGRLGAGGQGVVYEAYGPDGDRVAIKVLHGASDAPQELARMAAEARAAQRVASFCTARILQVRLEPPRPYIVSEYIDGLSLQAAVTGAGGRAPRRFAGDDLHRLGIGIVTALSAIHQAKVVHRDLKPGNVMLGPDGPRLIDFGIARMLDSASATRDGGLVGTLRYMAPEVYAGRRAGAEADVFAWGAIMVFAATGRPAFTGGDLPQIAHQIRTCDPDLSALPEPLRALVAAALAKDPIRRPPARELLAALTGDPRHGGGDAAGPAGAGPLSGWEPGDPALGGLAEDAYTALPPHEQNLVPEVFLRCLVPGDDGSWSTRPVPVAELFDRRDPAEGEALKRVVRAFAPLLGGTGEHTPVHSGAQGRAVEQVVLHRPALLRAWPRLREWAEGPQRDLAAHHRVRQTARIWDDNGRRRGDVLSGVHLDQAMSWAASGLRPFPNRVEGGLLDASIRAQTARTRRVRVTALVLAVTTLLSLTATGWAVRAQYNADVQRDAAASQRDIALSRHLVAQSEQAGDPTVAAMLAAAAWRIRESPESRAALLNVLAEPSRAVLTGHGQLIQSVTFSPDGRTLATASNDKTVRLWDVATRRQTGVLTGHTDYVGALAFSPDGRTLASGGSDETVLLWDVAARRQTGVLTGHTDIVTSVAFSPDGRTLATTSYDETVRLWDVATRHQTGVLTGHAASVTSVDFSPDGRTLASSGYNRSVRLWDVATRRQVGILTGHTDHVNTVEFSPDGRILATASDDETVRLWDVGTRRQIRNLTGHATAATSVAFSPDGRALATSEFGKPVRLWDVDTGTRTRVLTGHTDIVYAVAFSPDGRTVATGGEDLTVRLWDVGTLRQSGALTSRNGFPGAMAFSPDGRTLAAGEYGESVRLWDVRTRRQIGALTGPTDIVLSIAFSPDGGTLATGGEDHNVRLWDANTLRLIGTLTGHTAYVSSVDFSPDGRTLVTGGHDGEVRLWDVKAHRQIGALTRHPGYVNAVDFSPDGRTLATGGDGSKVRLWDVKTRRQIGALTGHTNTVNSVAFSPDGRTLATGGDDGTARLWQVASHRHIGALNGHTEPVLSVAFSPDGRTLATGGQDKTVRLWDVTTRHQTGVLTGHTAFVFSVAFSPDGRTLATNGDDRQLRLWDVAMPADLVGSVCQAAGRTLTPQEWSQYVPSGVEFRRICP